MRKIYVIARCEYRMQWRRPAVWGILIAAAALALWDSFPSAGNLARLEFLNQPTYFVQRIMGLDGLIVVFGLTFLLAGRLDTDRRAGVRALMLAAPLRRWEYALGKLLGGFCLTFSALGLFLTVLTAVYWVAAPEGTGALACALPLGKALACCVLPVSLFAGFVSVTLPAWMDVRLFYLLAAAFFGVNAAYVGSAEGAPWWLLTSGDLLRLIWTHPRWPGVSSAGVAANAAFLVGCALAAASLLLATRKWWRRP